jgi:hypothetical protein
MNGIYDLWQFFKRDFWPGYAEFEPRYFPGIFNSLNEVDGYYLIPLAFAAWCHFRQLALEDPASIGFNEACEFSGPLETVSGEFKGRGIFLETRQADLIVAIPQPWDINVYPEDPAFFFVRSVYFIGPEKEVVRSVIEEYMKAAKGFGLANLFEIVKEKVQEGLSDYGISGGEIGLNSSYLEKLISLYTRRVNPECPWKIVEV